MPQPPSEAELLHIYWQTVEPLYGYASRRCGGDRELAEDVTQETWLRALREWPRKGIPDVPLAWLTTVARNLIVDQLRRRVHSPIDHVAAADVLVAIDQDEVTNSAEITAVVTGALTRLPKEEARLLEAFHFERSKVAALATAYGVTDRAIEGRLRRARERLRVEIEKTLTDQRGLI